jgi:hypothetical protein
MREYRSREGPFPIRLSYETSEIDTICLDALRSAKLLPESPQAIKVDLFLERYFRVVVDYPDLGEDVMGTAVFNSIGAVTGFMISSRLEDSGTSGERRIRSTLAHEGGHGLLHSRLFMEEGTGNLFGPSKSSTPAVKKFLCRKTDIGPASAVYSGKWWEWQANRAIGGLLLPKPLVKKSLEALLRDDGFGATLPAAQRKEAERLLAEVFDVNPVVARIRIEEMFPSTRQEEL